MPELGSYGSVRGARGNSRPYREPRPIADLGSLEFSHGKFEPTTYSVSRTFLV